MNPTKQLILEIMPLQLYGEAYIRKNLFLDAGYIWAPYITMQTTPPLEKYIKTGNVIHKINFEQNVKRIAEIYNNFSPRINILQRYGEINLNNRYYSSVTINTNYE